MTVGAIALLLATTGLNGVQDVVGQRTREIGIRMALGAGHRQVAMDLLRRGAVPAAIGCPSSVPPSPATT